MIGIEKDGWRAEALPEDLAGDDGATVVAAVCTYCEQEGHKVFLQVDIDARMKPYWRCARERHRFPHSEDLLRVAGLRFA